MVLIAVCERSGSKNCDPEGKVCCCSNIRNFLLNTTEGRNTSQTLQERQRQRIESEGKGEAHVFDFFSYTSFGTFLECKLLFQISFSDFCGQQFHLI